MNDPRRVRVSGPLSTYRDGFAEGLARQGYTPGSAQRQVGLLAHLSRWLDSRGLGAADLTAEVWRSSSRPGALRVTPSSCRSVGCCRCWSICVPSGWLRSPPEPVPCTPAEMLLRQYGHYLVAERGLAAASIEGYLSTARLFLSERERPDGLDLGGLTARDVTAFVVGQCRSRRAGSAKTLVTALRSLLRFLYLEGCTPCPLAQAVPAATGWADSGAAAAGAEAVAALLASCDRHTLAGARDFAILMCSSVWACGPGRSPARARRHRLAAGEIVGPRQGRQPERLPLPVDVGEALVAYLRRRPGRRAGRCSCGPAPRSAGLTSDGVRDVVRGMPARRAARWWARIGCATARPPAMLRGGASLDEVGQVLRQPGRRPQPCTPRSTSWRCAAWPCPGREVRHDPPAPGARRLPRRAPGAGLQARAPRRLLPDFVAYLDAAGATTITTELAVAWATQPGDDAHRLVWAPAGDGARLRPPPQAIDPATEIPPAELLPCRNAGRALPVLRRRHRRADGAARRSLPAAGGHLRDPDRAAGRHRHALGEALRLDRDDIDWDEGVLTVWDSKFGKSRALPLHPSTIEARSAATPAARRAVPASQGRRASSSPRGTRLGSTPCTTTFSRLVRNAGLDYARRAPATPP